MAFGLGPHRCLGSHHVWITFRVMLEEVLARVFPTSASPDRSCASKTPATCTPCVSCRSRSRPAPAAPRPEPGARTMDINDLILVSVDDHVVEPPRHVRATRAGEVRRPRPARHPPATTAPTCGCSRAESAPTSGSTRSPGRPPDEYGFEPTASTQMRPGCFDVARAHPRHERQRRARRR